MINFYSEMDATIQVTKPKDAMLLNRTKTKVVRLNK